MVLASDRPSFLEKRYAAGRVHPAKPIERSPKLTRSAKKTLARPESGELALLAQIRSRAAGLSNSRVRLGIGDDCALLRLQPREELAITTDLSIEGRHFHLDWHPPESVGHRTLARGLSDLAAMGAKPVAAFLSLGVPANLTRPGSASIGKESKSWVERFYDGFLALAKRHNVPLAGGDLAESPLVLADIVLTGAVPKNKALLRAGARPGDKIYVTGSLGGSAAQFSALSKSPKHFANQVSAEANQLSPHLYPQPRIAQGLWLRKHRLASAAMDLSDGLSTDLAHLCQESGVCAEIDAGAIPLGAGATLQLALDGGEDYELLFTAPRSAKLPRSIAGVPITSIGRIQKKAKARPQLLLVTGNARTPIEPRGWQHFSQTK